METKCCMGKESNCTLTKEAEEGVRTIDYGVEKKLIPCNYPGSDCSLAFEWYGKAKYCSCAKHRAHGIIKEKE